MNRLKLIFLGCLFSCIIFSVKAQEKYQKLDDVEGFREKLEKATKSTSSIKADFRQEKYMDILSNTIESQGEIIFKKPNLLKWSYRQPFQYTIALNGKEIKIKDEEKTNTFDIASSKVFKQVNDLIVSSVNGQVLQEDKFRIRYFQDEKHYIAFMEPMAEQMKNFISEIELFFDKSDLTVNKIILHEPNADYTIIQFFNKQINSNVPDEAFNIH